MKATKEGQIVKYKTLFPDENPDQRFVVLEIHFDVDQPRALIKELNGGNPWATTKWIFVDEITTVEVDATELLGHEVIIDKEDRQQAKGKVVKVNKRKIMLELTKEAKGVKSNVWMTIKDEFGKEHTGTLFVN